MTKTLMTIFQEMRLFIVIWLGQLIAFIGSSITSFAIDIWVYQSTGSITQFALVLVFSTLPMIVLSPFVGSLIDRWDRRWALLTANIGIAVGSLVIGGLYISQQLAVWHIYALALFHSVFASLLWTTTAASITILVPKQHYNRANGMSSMSYSIARIAAPPVAGALLPLIHIPGIVLIDISATIVAIICLLLIRFPPITYNTETVKDNSIWQDTLDGLTYLITHPGLLGLAIFTAFNIYIMGGVEVLIPPLVLSFASTKILGIVSALFGFCTVIGGLIISLGGWIDRKINIILMATFVSGIFISISGCKSSLIYFTSSLLVYFILQPVIGGLSQTILQSKVEFNMQGRVISIKSSLEIAALSLGFMTFGSLAEIFEKLMVDDGYLAKSIGLIIGVGTGRGIGLILLSIGFIVIVAAAISYFLPRLRFIEDEYPDINLDTADPASESETQDTALSGT